VGVAVAASVFPPTPMARYYKRREKSAQLNVRIPESLKAALEEVVRLWRAQAIVDGDPPDDMTLTYVVERLLTVGVEGAWGEKLTDAGLKAVPKTDEEWAQLERSMAKAVKRK
jgi:hypothetical protein